MSIATKTANAAVTQAAQNIGTRIRDQETERQQRAARMRADVANARQFTARPDATQSAISITQVANPRAHKRPTESPADFVSALDYGQSRVVTQIVKVTPTMAADWLQSNTCNRPLVKSVARRYAATMRARRWKLNGQAIIFGSGGGLLDGQHRLWGCVESNVPFTTLVVRGVDPEVFDTLDNGRRRGASDSLALLGYAGSKQLAAAAFLLMAYRSGNVCNKYNLSGCEPGDIIDVVQRNPGLVDSLVVGWRVAKAAKFCPASIVAFCHYLFARQDSHKADVFFDRLGDGAGLSTTDPVYQLRRRFTDNHASRTTKLNRVALIALLFKAWNATKAGESMRSLKWNANPDEPEAFPTI